MNVGTVSSPSKTDATTAFAELLTTLLAQSPHADCVRDGVRSWSRAELLKSMQDVSTDLREQGLKRGEPVIINLPHSFGLIAAMCGVLHAGGLAVPVDPDLPDERRTAIAEDVNARLVLSGPEDGAGIEVTAQSGQPALGPDLAFLVYTSGSSGRPKGVEISTAGYLGRLKHITLHNPAQPSDVDLMWTPSSFIGMLDEVFFPLMLGVPIAIAPTKARSDPNIFADFITDQKVTTFRITPSLLNVFLSPLTADRLRSVRAIFCSGETLGPEVQQKVHALLDTTLLGFYGATEAPGVAYHLYDADGPLLPASFCTPQPFADIKIVDKNGSAVRGDTQGEILVGGLAVAHGYWNRPDLSAEKFQTTNDGRYYRTGDLGSWRPGGQFEILGRADMAEVNLRGVRVALADICQGLKGLSNVDDAWVTTHPHDKGGDPSLVAHVVTNNAEPFDLRSERRALSQLIPTAAIPTRCLTYAAFPLTANGKLDIQQLTKQAETALATQGQGASQPATTKITPQAQAVLPAVLAAVQDVLQAGPFDGTADFFDIGGDSLKAVEVSLLINERLGANISSTAVFNSTSLIEIAETLSHGHMVEAGPCRLLRDARADIPPIFTINATGNYARLAKALSYDGAVFNLNIFGLTNRFLDRLDDLTLEDMARNLADEVRRAHPDGPWKMMAFCQDGCLAVEIGRILLRDHGGQCDLLLIDTFFTDHGPNLKMSIMRLFDFGPGYYLQGVKRRLGFRQLPDRIDPQQGASPEQSAALFDKSKNDGRLYRQYTKLFMSYDPDPYAGEVDLFTSGEWRHANLSAVSRLSKQNLRVTTFPGLHGMIFVDGQIHHLADAIDGALQSTQRAVH